ncbi:hypothetical protein TorRG33x02_317950, partial [Trema orientale]
MGRCQNQAISGHLKDAQPVHHHLSSTPSPSSSSEQPHAMWRSEELTSSRESDCYGSTEAILVVNSTCPGQRRASLASNHHETSPEM